jgi:hypothetical protein
MPLLRSLPRFPKAYRAVETLARRVTPSRRRIEEFQRDRLDFLGQHALGVLFERRGQYVPGWFRSSL